MYYTFEGREIKRTKEDSFGQWVPIILEIGNSYSYGDFQEFKGTVTEENKKTLFITPELLEGSDYSGSTVQKSNHRSFLKMFKKVEGVYDLYGGYSTFAVAIRLDVYESNEEIKEVLDGIEDYPVVDQDDLTELECEQQQEAMPELIRDVRNDIDLEEYIPEIETLIEDDEKLESLIWKGIEELNLDWDQQTTGAYLNPDEVLPYVQDKILLEHCKDLPLFINRKWSCNETRIEFESKLKGAVPV